MSDVYLTFSTELFTAVLFSSFVYVYSYVLPGLLTCSYNYLKIIITIITIFIIKFSTPWLAVGLSLCDSKSPGLFRVL